MNCKQCGIGLIKSEETHGYCNKCENTMTDADRSAINETYIKTLQKITLTTETTIAGDYKRIAIIASEHIIGLNIFKDLFASISDITGSRSNTLETAMKTARETVLNSLKAQALALDASAVIAVDIKYNELTGKGSQMLFIAATGTAIKTTNTPI